MRIQVERIKKRIIIIQRKNLIKLINIIAILNNNN